ncbi:MAG TPA: NAD(P)/FAD-dependent oxidoreductase [Lysobacter sp.]|nr:NAD(P)/FAD-dependent oxidoreductase [Lysobacter sp.]
MAMSDVWDCVVVGAGPGGLSAALYLARFRRRVLVLHDGTARALRIPRTHNVPGFPDGIAGPDLVARMIQHAEAYGAQVREAEVVSASRAEDGFSLATRDGERVEAPVLVLATGLFLNQIALPHVAHEAAIRAGVLRYCPICDGNEHSGQRIGVVGCDAQGAAEALFLRTYSKDVTLVPRAFAELDAADLHALAAAGIRVVEHGVERFEPGEATMRIHLKGGAQPLVFDVVYPALGCRQRTELASALGLPLDDAGAVDAHAPYGTSVAGLYCAGDIVDGLDQISVAMGHGAIAATRAHNFLRAREAERRTAS